MVVKAIRSTHGEDYQHVNRPIAVLIDEYPTGFVDPPHAHERAQLLYATEGVMTVITDAVSFTIPPQRGVWMPAGVRHEAHCRGHVSLKTLYVASETDPRLPSRCQSLKISPLLRELIIEASHLPIEYALTGRDARIMELILDEIAEAVEHPVSALNVPMPSDPRLVRICRAIMDDPSSEDDLDHWADVACMGRRTFTRAFRRETGVSFSEWRQQVRLAEAISMLSQGKSVTSVAYDVGYNSPSAFTAMFQRAFGASPSQYFDPKGQPRS
ncbi:AraC family transcriptional regulator [Asticcacaulis machinosus]|uniref:Helix-turn-helix transcriptional regulator n=1 Tax=Asticcacaulis machinosus TaxID=2984211 RepID=A0ABT5HHD6_9CAUL|nr:helix-turn-helix transcriptional regulator [Asticcacaulis machinosus]MDC7675661.1 helix-turn-helix transcriptional regulator [Asticcacaulis machinosus]